MTGAAVSVGKIVLSTGLLLAAVATVARASRDDVAADSGGGVSLIYFFGTEDAPAGQGLNWQPQH